CMLPPAVFADNGNIAFTCVARRADQKSTDSKKGDMTVTKEDWQYVVTLENTTFNDVANLEVNHISFFKHEELGSLAGARLGLRTGSTKVDSIKGHDKATFSTVNVKLTKASLAGGYYFKNGANAESNANLAGLWIRIYQNGNLIAEMSR